MWHVRASSLDEAFGTPDDSSAEALARQYLDAYAAGDPDTVAGLYAGGGSKMRSVTFSHDGRYLAAGDDDGTVRLWDASGGLGDSGDAQELTRHARGVWSLAFSRDGGLLASADRGGMIRLYELATGERPFKGETLISVISSIVKDTPTSIIELYSPIT